MSPQPLSAPLSLTLPPSHLPLRSVTAGHSALQRLSPEMRAKFVSSSLDSTEDLSLERVTSLPSPPLPASQSNEAAARGSSSPASYTARGSTGATDPERESRLIQQQAQAQHKRTEKARRKLGSRKHGGSDSTPEDVSSLLAETERQQEHPPSPSPSAVRSSSSSSASPFSDTTPSPQKAAQVGPSNPSASSPVHQLTRASESREAEAEAELSDEV